MNDRLSLVDRLCMLRPSIKASKKQGLHRVYQVADFRADRTKLQIFFWHFEFKSVRKFSEAPLPQTNKP
jgi:hypothetical protein